MVCQAGHVNAPKAGQKVALLVKVSVARDLGMVGTLRSIVMVMVMMMILMMMIRRRRGEDE